MSAVLSPKQTAAGAKDNTIRAFIYRACQSELDELRWRIAATRFPDKEPVSDVQWTGTRTCTVMQAGL